MDKEAQVAEINKLLEQRRRVEEQLTTLTNLTDAHILTLVQQDYHDVLYARMSNLWGCKPQGEDDEVLNPLTHCIYDENDDCIYCNQPFSR